jgi:7,8-dihydropterin-6-yl-methyl-4-(beta-D-ribofuranosyl)aminobenzene 5'-phosphate synthase
MKRILMRCRDLGVRYVGPCHCTGETQIKAFEKAYGEHFLRVGVGKVVRIRGLK